MFQKKIFEGYYINESGIVGYGPAASVAAVMLSTQGHQVIIYERNQSPYDVDFATMKNRSYPLLFNSKAA